MSKITGRQDRIEIPVKRLEHGLDLPLPAYATDLSAGMDLLAALDEPLVLLPGHRQLIPTGLAIALPAGYEAQVRPRSGLALKHGLSVLNSPGTIDADYRGEIGVILIHLGDEAFTIERGMRIAQLVLAKTASASLLEVSVLPESLRAEGGFGSTGLEGSEPPDRSST